MNDVEKALLGDVDAQERLSQKCELLPCPNCGYEPELSIKTVRFTPMKDVKIECKCGLKLEGRVSNIYLILYKWNHRVTILTEREKESIMRIRDVAEDIVNRLFNTNEN